MNREHIWNRIREELQLPDDIYQWDDDAVICIPCKRKRLRTLETRNFVSHNHSQRHLTNLQNLGNETEVKWQRIRGQLNLNPNIYSLQNGDLIHCACCDVRLETITVFNLRKHDNSYTHRQRLALWEQHPEPSARAIAACSSKQSPYWMELTEMLLTADIPLNKLKIPACKTFMRKWTKKEIPDPSTLRKTYVPNLYESTIQQIRDEIGDCPIHLSIDETRDASRRMVVHAIVTPLMHDRPRMPRLLHMEELIAANAQTICDFVETSLTMLWPNGIHRNRVLIYATDSGSYMVRSALLLRNNYDFNKLVHVRCICHGLHLVVGQIRAQYPDVDDLIGGTKKIFSNSPNRARTLHEVAPNVPMPPAPILIRWGTWINACTYYDQYFDVFSDVFDELEFGRDVIRIMSLQQKFRSPEIRVQLEQIAEKFTCLAETITHLEARDLSLDEFLETFTTLTETILQDHEIPASVRAKMISVIEGNDGLQAMIDVNDCVKSDIFDTLPPGWTVEDAVATRFASLTSVEVERSFSKFKSLFRDNRRSFTFENLRRHMIVHCFGT